VRRLLFAANWKMHLGPDEARAYLKAFRRDCAPIEGREVWFFAPAVSLEAVAHAVRGEGRDDLLAGAQNIHWEPKGAFTGEISGPLAVQAGARATLVGHSERRQLFGETDEQTARKVDAALNAGLVPVLCVGETLSERERDQTIAVVTRQLATALRDGGTVAGGRGTKESAAVARIVIAYEPVWAIGTGRNATPADAAHVHRAIRRWLSDRGMPTTRVLYGGSVNLKNVAELLAEPEVDGVLVGGASLDPSGWTALVRTGAP
jgi:triosephosphate isomerase